MSNENEILKRIDECSSLLSGFSNKVFEIMKINRL